MLLVARRGLPVIGTCCGNSNDNDDDSDDNDDSNDDDDDDDDDDSDTLYVALITGEC